jgi:acyl transferase domain-containing protein/acyl carrier protein
LSFSDRTENVTGPSNTKFPDFPDTAVAIVGASCRLPGANDLDELWKLVSERRDCHQKAPKSRFDSNESFRVSQSGSPTWMDNLYGNFIDITSFDNSFFGVNPKEAANMDPQQRLLLELSYEALDSSGYLATHVRERGDAVGCFIGASMVEYLDNTNAHPPTAYTSTGTLRAFLCGRLSYYYGWTGPSEVIDTACSSSLVAIHRACTALLMGECTTAVAGGVNAITGINNLLDLGKAGFLSPTGQCKAFDVSADGYCRAEGAGLVVLKLLKDAINDNDNILGVIPGIATNQGGLSPALTVPSTQALQALYKRVLVKAGLSPSHISYVEAHATGTQAGDPVEMDSIRAVFGDPSRVQPLFIGSIKGNTGHCETAAGVAGLLKVLAMIKHGAIPPQANYHTLNPKIPSLEMDSLEIPRNTTAWVAPLRAALVNSYGAAGSNCALLCCEIPKDEANPRQAAIKEPNIAIPLFLSAASETSLLSYAQVTAKYLSQRTSDFMLTDIAFTLNHRRKRNKFCLAVTTTGLHTAIESFACATTSSFELPSKPKPVCLVFGGQNDDRFSISRTFMDAYPAFRAYVDSCDAELVRLGYTSLYPTIFDGPSHSSAVSQQCRLFAVQYASARCWIDAGLEISAVIGHSLGELAALVVAGALSLVDGIKLVAARAHLMDTIWGADRGAMLAIFTTASEVERLIARVNSTLRGPKLGIACYNAPRAIVVAGASTQIELATEILTSDTDFRSIRFQRLSTTHAFHSELAEPILSGIDRLAATIKFKEPILPLEFCTADQINSIDQWSPSKHAREPVYFSEAVRRVEKRLGSCFWLEAGLNTCAISLTRKASMGDASHTFQSLDIKARNDSYNAITETVSALWRHGSFTKHWALLAMMPKQIWLPPYQFDKRSHGIENVDRAMEAHKKLAERTSVTSESASLRPRQLVSLLETTKSTSTFLVDGQCERFQQIVTGHSVVGCPLCPASMYMECTVMAIQLLVAEPQNPDLLFEDLEFSAPLGVRTDGVITIQITRTASNTAWDFTVRSTLPGTTSRPNVHCAGRISAPNSTSLASFARLLGDPLQKLMRSETAERLKTTRIYGLFSKVVNYEPFLKSISSIILDETEAVATVQLSEGQPGREESAAWHRCDAPLLDAFISVAGFLINSSESVSGEQVMVAVAVERTIITTSCSATSPGPWKVYARFMSDDTHAISDIFVYDSQQKAVAMFGGVRFIRVPLARLKKTLSALDVNPIQTPLEPITSISTASSVSIDTAFNTPDTDMELIRQPPQINNGSASQGIQESSIRKIVSEYTGIKESAIPLDSMLVDLGVDSLSSLELATDIATKLGLIVDSFELGQLTVADILKRLHIPTFSAPVTGTKLSLGTESVDGPDLIVRDSVTAASKIHQAVADPIVFRKPFDAMAKAEEQFEAFASRRGFTGYWSRVAPLQNELLVAYILEAFSVMGLDLGSLPPGVQVPPIVSQPRYARMLQRLWEILQTHGFVEIKNEVVTRKSARPSAKRSLELHQEFVELFPDYVPEARLMQLAGQKLAECLSGKQEPVGLLFGNRDSSKIMEDYYHNSPMLSAATDLLVAYIVTLLRDTASNPDNPLRILEVGAGTGGTTSRLIDALSEANVVCEYTFTDISPVLVAKAKSKFAKYPFMTFTTLDLETEIRHDFRSGFNIIIATNCTHATKSRVTSCRRLKDALAEHGILILSEVTRTIDWYDMCFGLLDGWWLAGNGTEYPLQPASVWMDALSEACFASFGFSKGSSEEAKTQRLLVGVVR